MWKMLASFLWGGIVTFLLMKALHYRNLHIKEQQELKEIPPVVETTKTFIGLKKWNHKEIFVVQVEKEGEISYQCFQVKMGGYWFMYPTGQEVTELAFMKPLKKEYAAAVNLRDFRRPEVTGWWKREEMEEFTGVEYIES
jgi:hypothetical protein